MVSRWNIHRHEKSQRAKSEMKENKARVLGKRKPGARQGENVARGIHRTIPLRKANIRWRWQRCMIGFAASCGWFFLCKRRGGCGASKSNILNIDAHRFQLESTRTVPGQPTHTHSCPLFIIKTFAISYSHASKKNTMQQARAAHI